MTDQEEQMKALQEHLAKMSPEEREQFFRQRCVFCQIIDGKIDSKKSYEDEQCVGVFDINPATPGHVLLLPKAHHMVGPQVPEPTTLHIGRVVKRISQCMLRTLDAQGTTIFAANGGPAGQQSQHFMIHVIPRYEEGDVPSLALPQNTIDQGQLAKVAEHLREYNKKKFGITFSESLPTPTPEENEIVEKEMVKKHIKKEAGYLYFVDKDGDIARLPMRAPKGTPQEKVIITELGPLESPAKPKRKKSTKKKAAKKTAKKNTKKKKAKKKEEEEEPSELEQAIVDEGPSDLDRISRLFG